MIDTDSFWRGKDATRYKVTTVANSLAKDRELFPLTVVFVDCKTGACYACELSVWEKNFRRES